MVGWSEGDTKEKGLSVRECTTELHNPSNTDSHNSGPKMKSILTDEDEVPNMLFLKHTVHACILLNYGVPVYLEQ